MCICTRETDSLQHIAMAGMHKISVGDLSYRFSKANRAKKQAKFNSHAI